ncbi:hypothetical protein PMAYCL1PPCAC_15864, partial [Pristionchus mayeri]
MKIYRNVCGKDSDEVFLSLLDLLIYLSYICAAVILLIYLLILRSLRNQRLSMHNAGNKSVFPTLQLQLLKQNLLVFCLYAISILCVFTISFVQPGHDFGFFEIAYIENLLNLSIAAAYPIC